MNTKWFTYFAAKDDESKDKVRVSILAAKRILDAAIAILKDQQAAIERPKLDDYDCPSWSHRQAHLNGEIAGINKAISLLTIKG